MQWDRNIFMSGITIKRTVPVSARSRIIVLSLTSYKGSWRTASYREYFLILRC